VALETHIEVHVDDVANTFILLVEESFEAKWGLSTMGKQRLLLL